MAFEHPHRFVRALAFVGAGLTLNACGDVVGPAAGCPPTAPSVGSPSEPRMATYYYDCGPRSATSCSSPILMCGSSDGGLVWTAGAVPRRPPAFARARLNGRHRA